MMQSTIGGGTTDLSDQDEGVDDSIDPEALALLDGVEAPFLDLTGFTFSLEPGQ
jgi:hypothetical protein